MFSLTLFVEWTKPKAPKKHWQNHLNWQQKQVEQFSKHLSNIKNHSAKILKTNKITIKKKLNKKTKRHRFLTHSAPCAQVSYDLEADSAEQFDALKDVGMPSSWFSWFCLRWFFIWALPKGLLGRHLGPSAHTAVLSSLGWLANRSWTSGSDSWSHGNSGATLFPVVWGHLCWLANLHGRRLVLAGWSRPRSLLRRAVPWVTGGMTLSPFREILRWWITLSCYGLFPALRTMT